MQNEAKQSVFVTPVMCSRATQVSLVPGVTVIN